MSLTLRIHDEELSVCQLALSVSVPADILSRSFTAFLRSQDEVTLICPTPLVPHDAKVESGWIALELVGPFDFGLTGILTEVANPLAEAKVSIFALSTFNTDYVLIKAAQRMEAIAALRHAGHTVIELS